MDQNTLKFRCLEVPEGRSELRVALPSGILMDGDPILKNGVADLHFFKTEFYIEVQFTITATVELVCFRSLEAFDFKSESTYKVLFKEGATNVADEGMAERSFTQFGEAIDLTEDIRDTILLSLPAQPLHPRFHDEDGIPVDFEVQMFGTFESVTGQSEVADPRWIKLKELKEQQSSTNSQIVGS